MTYIDGTNIELFFTVIRDLPNGEHKIILGAEGGKRYLKIIEGGSGEEKIRIPLPEPKKGKDG